MPREKDIEIFTKLLVANQSRIFSYVYSLVHNRQATQDIMQEVSTVLWRKFDQFKPGTDFGAWGKRVARYTVFEWRRQQARLPFPMDDDLLEALSEEAVEMHCDEEEQLEALAHCQERLSHRDRELLRLRYEEKQGVTEIARDRDRSRVAIYKMLSRIHRDLLQCVRSLQPKENPLA